MRVPELRPYQQQAVERTVAFLRQPGEAHGLVVAPTGSGKSLIIASIATQLSREGRCLIFQPSKEILQQNAAKIFGYGFRPAVFSASMGTKEIGPVTLATIGSVARRPEIFADVRYVLVDEAHLVNAKGGQYAAFFVALERARIVGLTATPYRLARAGQGASMLKFLTRTRPRIFSQLVHVTQIHDLVKNGFLVAPVHQHVPGFRVSALRANSTGADYTDESVRRHFNEIGFEDRLRRVVLRLLERGRKSVLVFTKFVEDAERLVASLGAWAAVVHGEMPARERDDVVAAFRRGEIRVVANVGVLGVGFDYPELDTVVLARPTASLALYYQQAGRVMRPHPAKRDAWVVDMVDQLGLFGRLEDLRLRAGGKRGESWEIASRGRVLTNVRLTCAENYSVSRAAANC